MRALRLALAAALLAACQSPPPAPAQRVPAQAGAYEVLLDLGDDAFAGGDLERAAERYARALEARPGAAPPRVGLARVALARSDDAEARRLAEEALARDPDSAPACLVLAELEERRGAPAEAQHWLRRALRADPAALTAHARLAELTGPAPRRPARDAREALEVVEAHPYDPWAIHQAARALAEAGDPGAARELLHAHAWLAGIDPAAGLAGLRLLARLDPAFAQRRIVPVHCFADETLQSDPTWPWRLRRLFSWASTALEPFLDTWFVPVSTSAFSTAEAAADLASIAAAFESATRAPPPAGILAAFTERAAPRGRGFVLLGQAEYLGRRLVVRLEPEASESRTLLHEILHLYGGVHVSDELPSLLNPAGQAGGLDAANARIVGLVRPRRFEAAGLERNVLDVVDPARLREALLAALRLDLHFRRLGLIEAVEAKETSRPHAARLAREAGALDDHLGDVSRLLARLHAEEGDLVRAARFLELAAVLYGPRSRAGRDAARSAKALRRANAAETGVP